MNTYLIRDPLFVERLQFHVPVVGVSTNHANHIIHHPAKEPLDIWALQRIGTGCNGLEAG